MGKGLELCLRKYCANILRIVSFGTDDSLFYVLITEFESGIAAICRQIVVIYVKYARICLSLWLR